MSRDLRSTVLLLGCGYTLTRVLRRMPASRAVFTTRSDEGMQRAVAILGQRYEGMIADVSSPSSIRDVFERFPSIDTVVDGVPPFSKEGDDALVGVRSLCEVLNGRKIKRLIYLSTTGVFGARDGSPVNEETRCRPTTAKGCARLDSELAYRKCLPCSVAVRIPAIYGPGRGIGTALKNGTYRIISGKDRWSNRIHVDDLAEVLLRLLEFKDEPPKVLCAADNEPALISAVVEYYCTAFGLPRPPLISEEEALALDMQTQLSNQRISNKLLTSTLQMTLKYPSYKDGAETEFASK
jgi:nucleoside-diphosphate-sugar epimerase